MHAFKLIRALILAGAVPVFLVARSNTKEKEEACGDANDLHVGNPRPACDAGGAPNRDLRVAVKWAQSKAK